MSAARRLGVLCNPLSGRVKKRPQIRTAARALPAALYREAASTDEFHTILDEFAARDIELLLVLGGDGTFHAVLSHLLANKVFARLPVLCPIPAGTTNMTAHDLGITGSPLRLLRALSAALGKSSVGASASTPVGKVIQRPVLRILPRGAKPLYGMFFATGLIVEGVKSFKQHIQRRGLTGEGASALVMLPYLASLLFNRAIYGQALSLRADQRALPETHYLTVFASTLERLLLGTRPYWGEQAGPIHATMVRQAARGLVYAVPAALAGYGRYLKQENGYDSQNLHRLNIAMQGEFIVDGELYSVDKDYANQDGDTLEITASDTMQILLPTLKMKKTR